MWSLKDFIWCYRISLLCGLIRCNCNSTEWRHTKTADLRSPLWLHTLLQKIPWSYNFANAILEYLEMLWPQESLLQLHYWLKGQTPSLYIIVLSQTSEKSLFLQKQRLKKKRVMIPRRWQLVRSDLVCEKSKREDVKSQGVRQNQETSGRKYKSGKKKKEGSWITNCTKKGKMLFENFAQVWYSRDNHKKEVSLTRSEKHKWVVTHQICYKRKLASIQNKRLSHYIDQNWTL